VTVGKSRDGLQTVTRVAIPPSPTLHLEPAGTGGAAIPYGRNVAGASSSGKGMTNEPDPEQDAPATLNHQQEEILL
jgi:hypothetical protein